MNTNESKRVFAVGDKVGIKRLDGTIGCFGVIAGFPGDANLPIRYSESHDVVVRVDVYEGEKLEGAYMATFNDQLSKAEDTAMNTNDSKRVFAVGDRVRVTTFDLYYGALGFVRRVVGGRCLVHLDRDITDEPGTWFTHMELEPAPVTAAKERQDALTELWQSTAALYQRFGLQPTPEATRRVLREECGELCDMSARLEHMDEPGEERMMVRGDLSREIADVIVTAIGVGIAHGIDDMRLLNAIASVIVKNDAKTHVTHEVNSAGKIARKAVQS